MRGSSSSTTMSASLEPSIFPSNPTGFSRVLGVRRKVPDIIAQSRDPGLRYSARAVSTTRLEATVLAQQGLRGRPQLALMSAPLVPSTFPPTPTKSYKMSAACRTSQHEDEMLEVRTAHSNVKGSVGITT